MKRIIYLWVMMLCFPVISVAQEPEPTLFADDLYRWSTDVYFPQAIDFRLNLLRRESVVSSLSLSVRYSGIEPIVIEIDPSTVIETGAGGIFQYIWSIPPDNPPSLFSTVRYTWDIMTTRGQQYLVTGSFEFVDERVNWVQNNDLQSQVNIFHAENRLNPDEVWRGIRSTYELLFADTNNQPTLTVLVYPETVPIGCDINDEGEPILFIRRAGETGDIEAVACDLALAETIYEKDDYIVVNQTGTNQLQQIVIGLLVKEYYENQWTTVDVPAWFLFGLQQFYDPRPNIIALQTAQQAARTNDLLSLNELSNPSSETNQLLWEAQSTGMVVYLADILGVEGLYDFADSIGDYETFAIAYESTTGQSLDLGLLSWRDWLFRSSTEQHFALNPYLPDTPTPTATNTPTDTPTVTFTPSKTPDVSPTPRSSFTPIPPTPTITPLPPQSFSVRPTAVPPTPVPQEPSTGFVIDEGFTTRVTIGGGVIIALLILLYFILRKR